MLRLKPEHYALAADRMRKNKRQAEFLGGGRQSQSRLVPVQGKTMEGGDVWNETSDLGVKPGDTQWQ